MNMSVRDLSLSTPRARSGWPVLCSWTLPSRPIQPLRLASFLAACLLLFDLNPCVAGDEQNTYPPTIAVLEFEHHNVPADIVQALQDSICESVKRCDDVVVKHCGTPLQFAGQEPKGSHLTYTHYTLDDAVETGRKLRVSVVLVGSVTRLRKLLVVESQVVDVCSGQEIAKLKAESVKGAMGVPQLADSIAAQLSRLVHQLPPGNQPYPDEIEHARERLLANLRTSIGFYLGTGLYGRTSKVEQCKGVNEVCTEYGATLDWLAQIPIDVRFRDKPWILGFSVGMMSTRWSWANPRRFNDGKSLAMFAFPRITYTFYQCHYACFSADAGAGFRDFRDETGISNVFACFGCRSTLFGIRADLTYWHGLGSADNLGKLLTVSLGVGFELR